MSVFRNKEIDSYVQRCQTGEAVDRVYDDWASDYDKTMHRYEGNNEPMFSVIERLYSNNKDSRILDVGAGTGYVGKRLKNMGFTNVDAVDPSGKMLDEAINQHIYRAVHVEYVGLKPLPIDENTYDCVLTARCIAPNHLPPSAIPEFHRLLKQGGCLVVMGNLSAWNNFSEFHVEMMAEIKKLVETKNLEQMEWTEFDNFSTGEGIIHRGLLFVFKKL